MDLGHGGGSFSWKVAEKVLEQDFAPDVISSDIHVGLNVKTGSTARASLSLPLQQGRIVFEAMMKRFLARRH